MFEGKKTKYGAFNPFLNKNDSKDVDNFITPSRPKSKYQTRDILEGDVNKTSEHFRNQNIAMVCSKSKLRN